MNKVQKFWRKEEYYEVSEEASRNISHPAVVAIRKAALEAKKILDLGCGEGTRLSLLETKGEKFGVDISDVAIKKATKAYRNINFLKADIEELPFKKESFDLVYSMFVLEHVEDPQAVLAEATRVLAGGGTLILAAPNYGSPNRRSPNSEDDKISKLIKGLFRKMDSNILGWTRVEPQKGEYFVDADTSVEPYIGTLIPFLKNLGLKIVRASSLWEIDDVSVKQLLFRILGAFGTKPFVWWGPQIFIIGEK